MLTKSNIQRCDSQVIIMWPDGVLTVNVEPPWHAKDVLLALRDYVQVVDVAPTWEDVDKMLRVVCGITEQPS